MINTRLPARAASAAKLAEMLVLPTPPLPLVTAMTRNARAGAYRRAGCGRTSDNAQAKVVGLVHG